jgi:DNA-binding response OmpR family regulator
MMRNPAVLVIDDEEKILDIIKIYLEKNGYAALCAKTAGDGMALFETQNVSLILLDLMLPDFSGETFCRAVRKVSHVPIIMITAKVDEESIINGLKIGADDYVTKPFSPRQLMARVEAALRRTRTDAQAGAVLRYDDLAVDTENRVVTRAEKEIPLTHDEYNILTLLMARKTKIFTRDEILDSIKGTSYDGFDRAVDTHIKNLRAKIGDNPKSPRFIATVYGVGYRFGAARDATP